MVHGLVGPGAVLLGVALLVYGGARTVDAAASLARGLGLPTLFIGVTVVSVGSSVPEIATSVYSGFYGAGDLAVGHVVGSAISQITLGVGLVGLL
ncbi:MAG: sodium:calcium antiporter, partial [Halobacteriaceae archaeon]